MFYCIILILSIPIWSYLVSSLYISKERKNKLVFLGIAMMLCMIGGLRDYDTFNDSASYSHHFYHVKDEGTFYKVPNQRMEKGYLIFEKFIHKYISHDYPILFLITSFFCIGTTLFFFYKKSECLWFSVFLWIGMRCYFMQIQAVRQSIAIALLLIAILLLEKRKNIVAVLFSLLATTFHSTSIIGLAMIPLYYIPLKKKYIFSFILLSFGGLFFLSFIFSVFGFGDSVYLKDDNMKLGNIIGLICYLSVLIYSWKVGKDILENNRIVVWGTMLCVMCCIVSLWVTAFNRAASYFEPYALILLTNALQMSKYKKTHIVLICTLVFSMYIGVLVLKPEWNKAYPYYFFWERDNKRCVSVY